MFARCFVLLIFSTRMMLLRLESPAMLNLQSTFKLSIGQEKNLSLGHVCLHHCVLLKGERGGGGLERKGDGWCILFLSFSPLCFFHCAQ